MKWRNELINVTKTLISFYRLFQKSTYLLIVKKLTMKEKTMLVNRVPVAVKFNFLKNHLCLRCIPVILQENACTVYHLLNHLNEYPDTEYSKICIFVYLNNLHYKCNSWESKMFKYNYTI
jgi:hypothetical protein